MTQPPTFVPFTSEWTCQDKRKLPDAELWWPACLQLENGWPSLICSSILPVEHVRNLSGLKKSENFHPRSKAEACDFFSCFFSGFFSCFFSGCHMFDDLCRCSMQCNWKWSLGASETTERRMTWPTERGGVVWATSGAILVVWCCMCFSNSKSPWTHQETTLTVDPWPKKKPLSLACSKAVPCLLPAAHWLLLLCALSRPTRGEPGSSRVNFRRSCIKCQELPGEPQNCSEMKLFQLFMHIYDYLCIPPRLNIVLLQRSNSIFLLILHSFRRLISFKTRMQSLL